MALEDGIPFAYTNELRTWPQAVDMSDPTEDELADPLFQKIWEAIKDWNVCIPTKHTGVVLATGSHALEIYRAIKPSPKDPI